jgi:hypothetical protein
METVLSGIRSTGNLHLGNYYGAVTNFVRMQEDYNCFFFVADLHSLTTYPKPADLHANVKSVDPLRTERCTGNIRILPAAQHECVRRGAGAHHHI